MYEKGEEIVTTDGTTGKYHAEDFEDECYIIEMDHSYLVKFDMDVIDMINIGIPFAGKIEPDAKEEYEGSIQKKDESYKDIVERLYGD